MAEGKKGDDVDRPEWLDALNLPNEEGFYSDVAGIMHPNTPSNQIEEISKMHGVNVDVIEIKGIPRAKITVNGLLPKSKKKK